MKMSVAQYSTLRKVGQMTFEQISHYSSLKSGFGGLGVSVLSFGTQFREFKRGRSRRIFRAKKTSARLPSEGK